jgi:hypothetical protein
LSEEDETVELDNLSIMPFLDDPMSQIHPAIGVVDDVAYVGVWIPCLIKDGKGNVSNKDLLWLITSNREKILANNQELQKRHWRLAYQPIHFENRWALSDVQLFLKGKDVNVLDVYHRVLGLYKEFIEFPDAKLYDYHALWSIGTYLHHLFNTYPYLYVGGIKRSGKSKTLRLHFCIDFNALFSNNMSVSSIYRVIQNSRATLLIDETEKLINPNRALEFRSILLSGFQKGAQVFRVEKGPKDRLEPEAFEVYSPKALANISGLEDVLEDRCIMTFQKRSINKAIVNHEIDIRDERFSELRAELTELYLLHWKEINDVYCEISQCSELSELCVVLKTEPQVEGYQHLSSRELELWKPILSLALFFDRYGLVFTSTLPTLSSLILNLACSQAQQRYVENMTEVGEEILVAVLPQLVTSDFAWVKVKDVREKMNAQFEEPQEWITPKWIGSALKRLGFQNKRRLGPGVEYNISKATLEDLRQRMEIPELKEASNEEEQQPLVDATTCPICLKLIPEDLKDVTTWEGKYVHIPCFLKLEDGRQQHEN